MTAQVIIRGRKAAHAALVAALLGAAALGSCGPAAANEHLRSELSGLLQTHPQIRAGKKSVAASRKAVDESRADYLPDLSLSADAGPEYIDSPGRRDDEGSASTRTRNVASLTLTQNLYDGSATETAVRTARLNKEIAGLSLASTRQNTLFEGIQAYIDVLRQKRLIELARQNEANVQHQLELEDERVARGSGVTVDVLEAKRRLQAAKERRVQFEGAFQDAISRYSQVFDHAPDVDTMTDPAPPVDLLPTELEEAIDIAMRENPAVNTAATNIEVARQNKRAVLSEYAPTVDLVGSWNYEKHRNAVVGTRRDYSVVLQANWDLFTGFSTEAAAAQAAFNYGASKDTHLHTTRKVVEQTRLAWQSLITARERMKLLENAVNIAYEVWRSRQSLREAGKETVINVLDAENELSNAQINFTAAAYDERLAVYQLLLAMGRLNADFLALDETPVTPADSRG